MGVYFVPFSWFDINILRARINREILVGGFGGGKGDIRCENGECIDTEIGGWYEEEVMVTRVCW